MVPLLVTTALLLDELAPWLAPAPGAAPDELPTALEDPDVAEVAAVLLLLQAATPSTKDAATQPAVHLRMRI
jgi:hypothetical protein